MSSFYGGKWCTTKVLIIITVALVLVLTGVLVLSFYGIPLLITAQIHESVELKEGTDQWDRFIHLPIPVNLKVYFYEVKNGDEISNGAIPIIEETGPYVYKQDFSKNITSSNKHDDSITYQRVLNATFDQELSGDRNLSDIVTIVNPVLLILSQLTTSVEQLLIAGCLDKIFPLQYRDLFITTDVDTLLLGGFEFAQMSEDVGYACNVVRSSLIEKTKFMINIERVYSDDFPDVVEALRFSFLRHKIFKPDGIYTVNRGINDVSHLGNIMQWNYSAQLPYWRDDDKCKVVHGTDSTIYPPHINEDTSLTIFSTDICRKIDIVYSGKGSYMDISGLRFEPPSTIFRSENPEDDCYCIKEILDKNGEPSCYLDGLLDLNQCFGSPVLLSFPHFLYADESYVKGVVGLEPPDKDKHGIFLLIEPNTGTPLQGRKRIQLNLVLRPIKYLSFAANLPRTVLPVAWIEEGVDLTEDLADMINNQFFNMVNIVNGVKYALIAVSAASVLVTSILLLRKTVWK